MNSRIGKAGKAVFGFCLVLLGISGARVVQVLWCSDLTLQEMSVGLFLFGAALAVCAFWVGVETLVDVFSG